MTLEGSCACGAVTFSLESTEAVPYQRCYCGVCRKTQGGGGFLVNLGGDVRPLEVVGREHTRIFRATIDGAQSRHERVFCAHCASHLWAWHPGFPELVHPVAGAIDTALPESPERVHMMVDSRANWVHPEGHADDTRFHAYPAESLAEWHRNRGYDT